MDSIHQTALIKNRGCNARSLVTFRPGSFVMSADRKIHAQIAFFFHSFRADSTFDSLACVFSVLLYDATASAKSIEI